MIESLRSWCETANLEIVEERRTRAGLSLRVEQKEGSPAPVDVLFTPEGAAHLVRTERLVPGNLAKILPLQDLVERLVEARAGLLQGRLETRDGSPMAVFEFPLDPEALSRMGFLAAVAEVGKSRRSLERALADAERGQEELERFQESLKASGAEVQSRMAGAEAEAQAAVERMREKLKPKQEEPRVEPPPPRVEVPPPAPPPPPRVEVLPPAPPPPPPPVAAACAKCAKPLKPNDRFCTGCGTPV